MSGDQLEVRIESHARRNGLVVHDAVERRRYELPTDDLVTPESIEDPGFLYPVDAAARVETRTLRLPQVPATYLRDASFNLVAPIEHHTERELAAGRHVIEVDAPVKLYLAIEGPATVRADAMFVSITATEPREVVVGARSYHEQPAATITTTGEPADVVDVLSYLGGALKTTSAERAWPTLRGHPPTLTVGSERDIPDILTRPKTDVTVEIPATLPHAFVVAPLAYYLGATVAVGDRPQILARDHVHRLDGPDGFETAVERTLKRCFFLDCVTRSDGLYTHLSRERHDLEAALDVDVPALYRADPVARLATYLQIPHETVAPHVPQWKLTAHVDPHPDHLEVLPFLVDDLAVVHTPGEASSLDHDSTSAQLEAIQEFTRLRGDGGVKGREESRSGGPGDTPAVVNPEGTDSIEQTWFGAHVPVGASKGLVAAYRNRLDRDHSDAPIEVVVVCNETEMADEGSLASEVYGSRDRLPFDVSFYEDLTTDRLRFVLESDVDFLHYVGHIDTDGFRCTDGTLDAGTLDSVGMDAFFLNACASYLQGERLIERGAIGGVVTLDEIINSGAVRVGTTMTRLLNQGFPLRPALGIASERSVIGSQYIVIGDGNVDITHHESLTPTFLKVATRDDGYDVDIRTYPIGIHGMGATFRPEIADNEFHFLVGARGMEFRVTPAEFASFLDLQTVPMRVDGQFTWSDRFDP